MTGRDELQATGSKGSDNRNLYIYGDHLGSAILALDANQKEAMRLGYSPFGQAYRKTNDTKFWKLNSGVNANNQLNQLMPYQYTGRYTEGATGYTNLDARWYNPYTQRFNQPDYWSFNNTGLPAAVQHELMRITGLNTAQLLQDPAQQMRYGYANNNPTSHSDLTGLCPGCAVAIAYVVEQTPGALISGAATFGVEYAKTDDLWESTKKAATAFALSYATAGATVPAVAAKVYGVNLGANWLVDGTSPLSTEAQVSALSASLGSVAAYPVTGFIVGVTPTMSQLVIAEAVSSSASHLSYETFHYMNNQSYNSFCPAPE